MAMAIYRVYNKEKVNIMHLSIVFRGNKSSV